IIAGSVLVRPFWIDCLFTRCPEKCPLPLVALRISREEHQLMKSLFRSSWIFVGIIITDVFDVTLLVVIDLGQMDTVFIEGWITGSVKVSQPCTVSVFVVAAPRLTIALLDKDWPVIPVEIFALRKFTQTVVG